MELKHVIEINLIRVSYFCKSYFFHFISHLKQLYINNKAEWFSFIIYNGRCGIYVWMHLQEELGWAIDKWLQVVSNM